MFVTLLVFGSIFKYNIQLNCITILQEKMSKRLRDFDDVDVDDSGSTTPKKATSKNLASPIKVQYTPQLKTGKVVVQTKKNKKGIITRLDEKTQHPFVSWGGESVPKRPVDPTFLKVLPIDVDDPRYIIPDPTSFIEGQEVVIISGTFAGQIGVLKAWTGTSFTTLLKVEGEEGGTLHIWPHLCLE